MVLLPLLLSVAPEFDLSVLDPQQFDDTSPSALPSEPTCVVDAALAAASVRQVLASSVIEVESPTWNLTSEFVSEVAVGDFAPPVDLGRELRTMTFPLLLVWLSGPILSIIDTCVVGRTAGIAELAALGPATALCDTGTYFFNFLSIVTTGRVANAMVQRDHAAARRSVGDGVLVASLLGVVCSVALLGPAGARVLSLFTSAGGAEATQFFGPALSYVRIRALALVRKAFFV